jgi:hypothetical protein
MRRRRSRKPVVITNCVASLYEAANEKVVEFSTASGELGGLISLRDMGDRLVIEIYRLDAGVEVLLADRREGGE